MARAESGGPDGAAGPARVVFALDQGEAPGPLRASLEAAGYRVESFEGASEVLKLLEADPPAALVLRAGGGKRGFAALRDGAAELGVAVVELAEPGSNASEIAMRNPKADGLFFLGAPPEELAVRVALAVERRRQEAARKPDGPRPNPFDTYFLSLVIHDLRTPLNVIGLALRMIDQSMPKGDPELDEDLRFLRENFYQLDRMLNQLSDYCRLNEGTAQPQPYPFDPRRMVAELLEERASRQGGSGPEVQVEVAPGCPPEVELDQAKARSAIQHALSNAAVAAGESPVRLVLDGQPGRCRIELAVDRPPPSSVKATTLRPDLFERLAGIAAERRGLDLAIVARISELFGGSARLDVDEGRGTRIVLDWPARRSQDSN